MNYCSLLEGRIATLVYRSNVVDSMFEAVNLVKSAYLFVNGILINYVNFVVKTSDLLYFHSNIRSRIRLNFFKRFFYAGFIFNTPRFIFIDFKLFFLSAVVQAKDSDLVFPYKIDLYRATGFH